MSAIITFLGLGPAVKFTAGPNELVVMLPSVLWFRKTETLVLPLLAETISGLPSPSKSPTATPVAVDPTGKITGDANVLVVMFPGVLEFLRTKTSFKS
jgi:hypothetical protein